MSYASAELAVEAKLATVLGSLLTQWPNGPKVTPEGAPYAEVFHLPARTFVDTLGEHGQNVTPYVTQVNLYRALESGKADVDAFTTAFVSGWIPNSDARIIACGPGPSQRDGTYYKSIVTIEWEARVPR